MEVIYSRSGGIDVHKKTLVVSINVNGRQETRTYGSTTRAILKMVEWLEAEQIEIVAMESTGVYWKPVWNILECSKVQPMLVNAHETKQVPGRKTDVKDAEWICELLRHGLLRPSNVPSRDSRELRELIVLRRSTVDERSRTVNRLQKVLEGANIKMSSIVTDITGKSGTAILKALARGETDEVKLASLAVGSLSRKQEELQEALQGSMNSHQQFMLKMLVEQLERQNEMIKELDSEVEKRCRPFEEQLRLLDTVPGIARRGAEEIVAIVGVDMSRYPTAAHLASWLRLCPGNRRSADKNFGGRTARGNPLGKAILVQLAWAGARTRGSYFNALYKRLSTRRGPKRAVVAVAHSMIKSIYHVLLKHEAYHDLGANHFDEINHQKVVKRSVRRLEKLGYQVLLAPRAA
jgi:transposase